MQILTYSHYNLWLEYGSVSACLLITCFSCGLAIRTLRHPKPRRVLVPRLLPVVLCGVINLANGPCMTCRHPRLPIFPIYPIICMGSYKEPIFQEILLYCLLIGLILTSAFCTVKQFCCELTKSKFFNSENRLVFL